MHLSRRDNEVIYRMLPRGFASTNMICALDGPKGLNNNSRGRSPWLMAPTPAFRREPRRRRGSRRIKSWVPPTPDFIRGYRNSGPPGQVQIKNMVLYILAKIPISIKAKAGTLPDARFLCLTMGQFRTTNLLVIRCPVTSN